MTMLFPLTMLDILVTHCGASMDWDPSGGASGARQEGIPAPSTQQDPFSLFCVLGWKTQIPGVFLP